MYLEISARQTGKTTRLVNDVVNKSLNGKKCIIFSFSMGITRYIKNHILDILNNLSYAHPETPEFYTTPDSYHRAYIGRENEKENHFFYYDEFDFYRYPIIISNSGYYVTTAKRTRTFEDFERFYDGLKDDNMIQLLVQNGGKVVSYMINPSYTIKNLNDFKESFSTDSFNLEIQNMWRG